MSVKLPGLNRSAMSRAAIELCELAVRDGWPELVGSYSPERIGLYAQCFDSYEFKPEIFAGWQPGGDLRTFLRRQIPPTRGLHAAASMTPACLSILLGISGPIYTLPFSPGRCAFLEDIANLDFAEGRIDLAIFAYAKCEENTPDSLVGENGYVLFARKGASQ